MTDHWLHHRLMRKRKALTIRKQLHMEFAQVGDNIELTDSKWQRFVDAWVEKRPVNSVE